MPIRLLLLILLLTAPASVWAQQEMRGAHKGATDPGPVTSTELDANRQALDVCIKVTGGDNEECADPSGGGVGGGGSEVHAEDTAHTDGDDGVPAWCVRSGGSTTYAGTNDDYSPIACNSVGHIYTTDTRSTNNGASTASTLRVTVANDSTGVLASVGSITNALPAGSNNIGDVDVVTLPGTGTEDAAETAGGTLQMAGTVRRDTAASSAGSSGDNATLNTDANGLAWTRTIDPCSALAKTYIPINISTATTTELTSSLAGASNHYYVCSINIGPVAGAQNAALVDDDTDNCASVTSGLAGGTTAGTGWNIAANGGFVLGNGQASVARTNGTNRVLCLVTSAAVQTSGVMTVVAAP